MDSWWERTFLGDLVLKFLFLSICHSFPKVKDDLSPPFKGSAQAQFSKRELINASRRPSMA